MVSMSLVLPMAVSLSEKKPAQRWAVSSRAKLEDIWELSDVAKLVGFRHTVLKILGPLPLELNPGGRNMLWCSVDPSKTTTLRLEFKLTDQTRDNFKSWLGAEQKALDIKNVFVVARRTTTCQYGTTADFAHGEGMLTFRLDLQLGSVAFSAFLSLAMTEVTLRLQRDAGMTGSFTLEDVVALHGTLVCHDDKQDSGSVPMIMLGFVDVRAGIKWPMEGGSANFSCSLAVNVLLHDQSSLPPKDPAQMFGTMSYDGGSWRLSAGISYLTGAHLASFFPKGPTREATMEMLKDMSMDSLALNYEYDGRATANGAGKSFSIDGALSLGGLRLGLNFYNKGQGDWEFGATLSPKGDGVGGTTVKDVLKALLGGGDLAPLPMIPGEVLNIPVTRPGSDNELLGFKCKMIKGPVPDKDVKSNRRRRGNKLKVKPSDEPSPQLLVLMASVHLASVSLTFIQLRDPAWPTSVPSKRVMKVTVDQLGLFQAPLVGELKAPFEQLVYMWVADKATEKLAALKPKKETTGVGETQKPLPGITKGEFDALAEAIQRPVDSLFFKANKEKYASGEIVIAAGSHFMVMAKNSEGVSTAALHYVFARPSVSKPPKQSLLMDDDEKPTNDPAKAPLKKTIGLLTIDNVGLQYDVATKRLGVVLDATFLMGLIGLALLGFGLSCRLQAAQTSLSPKLLKATDDEGPGAVQSAGLPVSDFEVALAGLIVSFDKDPISIAGGFMHTTVDGADYYAGGLIFKFKPWMMMAAGVYGKVPREDPSVAHRRRVTEQGYESEEETSDDGYESYETDSSVGEYSTDNSVSFLADDGSFTILFVIFKLEGPLFSVGFADISGLTGGVGVNSSVRLPTAETVLDFPFVRQDGTDTKGGPIVALKSLLHPDKSQGPPWFTAREGSFWVAAGCKVTTFSMLAVDAVLVLQLNPGVQIGIYGVATMDVPSLAADAKFAHVELGIACTLDIGAGVFRLDAQLSPRSFVLHKSCHLTGGIAVGVRFSMDLWLVTVRISAEISATLSVMGPSMAGIVHVDFWVFGFDINFGDLDAARLPPPILSISKFKELALKSGGSSGKGQGIPLDWAGLAHHDGDSRAGGMAANEAKTTYPFLFNCDTGLIPNFKKKRILVT